MQEPRKPVAPVNKTDLFFRRRALRDVLVKVGVVFDHVSRIRRIACLFDPPLGFLVWMLREYRASSSRFWDSYTTSVLRFFLFRKKFSFDDVEHACRLKATDSCSKEIFFSIPQRYIQSFLENV